jgi:L-arabinokinase
MIVAYVSGHGFGHATRVGEVLRVLRRTAPQVSLAVVSAAPEALYRRALQGPFEFRAAPCDVGLAQRGPLAIDEQGTAEACAAFEARWSERLESERQWLKDVGARLVLGDIPPLAFAAAAAAGVPGIGLANFSWDWIYRHLARRCPALEPHAERAAQAYAQAELLLELPFAGDLSVFRRRERIPLVARRPDVPRQEARRRLGLDGRPAVLVSFGGIGMPGFEVGRGELAGYRVIGPEDVEARLLEAKGLGYIDVVGACDVVVTKPGYGIVSDAVAAGTRMIYTERGDFPEYPILVGEMKSLLACAYVSNDDLRHGRLRAALEAVLAEPMPAPPALDGAEQAAARLLEQLA